VTRVRIATFNLLHGVSLSTGQCREEDLRAAARRLDADVIGLQEVDRMQDRSGGLDQTAVVAEELGAGHTRFVAAVTESPGEVRTWSVQTDAQTTSETAMYGVGLVSRWPVREWGVRRFPPAPLSMPLLVPGDPPRLMRVPDEPRVAVSAVVEGPCGPFTVVTAHLSFVPGWNIAQLRRITRWVAGLPRPHVLAGDFNLPGPVPRLVTGWNQLARVVTYPSPRPRVQFDHVLGRGVDLRAVQDVRTLALAVSDHRALVVDVDLSS
jgi:endonuclease/exonuclease/phosphatase family metal-dependent hydrolase